MKKTTILLLIGLASQPTLAEEPTCWVPWGPYLAGYESVRYTQSLILDGPAEINENHPNFSAHVQYWVHPRSIVRRIEYDPGTLTSKWTTIFTAEGVTRFGRFTDITPLQISLRGGRNPRIRITAQNGDEPKFVQVESYDPKLTIHIRIEWGRNIKVFLDDEEPIKVPRGSTFKIKAGDALWEIVGEPAKVLRREEALSKVEDKWKLTWYCGFTN